MKVFLAFFLAMMLVTTAFAVVPPTMTYQGIFMDADGNVMPDGDYEVGFHIFGGPFGGPPDWTEYRTIHVENGIFEVVLGEMVPMNPAFIRQTGTWLGLSYNQQFLEPRQPMNSVAYSFRTCWADSAFGAATLGIHTPASITANQDSVRACLDTVKADIDTIKTRLDSLEAHSESCSGAFGQNMSGDVVDSESSVEFESGTFTVNCQSGMICFVQLINDGLEHQSWEANLSLVAVGGMVHSSTNYDFQATARTDIHVQYVDTSVEPGDYFLRVEVSVNGGEVDVDEIEFGAMWVPVAVEP